MPLIGENVVLREVRVDDNPYFQMLRNDMETQGFNQSLPPDYTIGMIASQSSEKKFSFERVDGNFTIEEKNSGIFVGRISYSGYEKRHTAAVGIALLKDFWGKGYGYEAHELLLKFLFLELGVRVVRWYTTSENIGSYKLAQKSGYQISVRKPEAIFKSGKLFDMLMLDLIRDDYFAQHPELTDELRLLP
ncbi:MAG: GNAT family N-acetyltransferase [Candidatus Heimdallarchaeota archaeon]|nr:GNAT family N-acetyltransferase [Candidatus Heimdallarchaeota archaeon]